MSRWSPIVSRNPKTNERCRDNRDTAQKIRSRDMGLRGVEPRTSRLSGVRSNHLSYRPQEPANLSSGSPPRNQAESAVATPSRTSAAHVCAHADVCLPARSQHAVRRDDRRRCLTPGSRSLSATRWYARRNAPYQRLPLPASDARRRRDDWVAHTGCTVSSVPRQYS